MKKLRQIDLSKRNFLLLAALAVLLRLLMTSQQRISVMPEITTIDDMLMVEAARHIRQGSWLGPYTYLAMSKHMFFAVWLAFVNWLGIPYLTAGHLLSVGACITAVIAVSPVVKNNAAKLALLAALIFCPALYADYTLRVYRDNITTSFLLFVFAGVIGMALRWNSKKTLGFWLFAVTGGLSFGISYLLREDGYWLIPFIAVGLLITLYFVFRKDGARKLQKVLAVVVMLVVSAGSVAAYAAMNYKDYDRFVVSDFTSAEFQAAYGAITRIKLPEDSNPIVPIDAQTRQKLYAASPAFAELEDYLEDVEASRWWRKDCGDGILEYSGGGFYWAIRAAASYEGYYETALTAADYYRRVADELNAAYDSGRLEAQTGERSALNTPLTVRYVWPTLAEVGQSAWYVSTYQGIACDPELSVGSRQLIDEVSAFAGNDAMETTTTPAPDSRIVVWAVSPDAPVTVSLQTTSGEPVSADCVPSTGGDIYLRFLDMGITLRYPDRSRTTATFIPVSEDIEIVLSCDGQTIVVPAREMAAYAQQGGIYYQVECVGSDYTEEVTFGTLELWLYRGMRLVVWGYRILSPVVLLAALAALAQSLIKKIKYRKAESKQGDILVLWIIAGLLLCCLLRLGMVAFVEVSAFGIGTNPMYLSAVYPLGILFSFLCFVWWRDVNKKKEGEHGQNAG